MIDKENKMISGHFAIILAESLLLIFFLHVYWFYVLGNNSRQQANDEENPETHNLLSNIDKENNPDGVYIFERNVQYKYKF